MACSDNKNPLQRGGTSQQERKLAALNSSYVRVDEKDFADWIVFADSFSEYLVYYNTEHKKAGNWKTFFDSDITSVLGSIAIQDIDAYRLLQKERIKLLQSDEQQNNIPLLKETLGALFSIVLTLSRSIDNYANKLPESSPLRTSMQHGIRSKLVPAMKRLLAYFKAGNGLSLITEQDYPDIKVLNLGVQTASSVIAEGLSQMWWDKKTSWNAFLNSIEKDTSVYGDENIILEESWNEYRRINHAANHNLFSGTFETFLMVYARIIKDAEVQLLERLTDYNDHPPHYALFLAFLKLFRVAQDDLNSITQRHLDFYYKEVLKLVPKVQEPNNAHIIIELAKQVDQHILQKGTSLKAGKDSGGKDVLYAMQDDVVFNKATVASLMTLYKGTPAENITDEQDVVLQNNTGRLYASPISNSADGMGAAIKTTNEEWHPFVNKTYVEGQLTSVNMPKAAIGFAISCAQLYLSEGERKVLIRIVNSGTKPFTAAFDAEAFVTTEKGWMQVTLDAPFKAKTNLGSQADATVLSFSLSGDAAAVTNYNAAVHGGTYAADTPLIRIYLSNKDDNAYAYEALDNFSVTAIEVEVRVGLNDNDTLKAGGLKKLQLNNDLGVIDPSKPFQPFGPAPKTGASLIIGNDEVFRKKNVSYRLRMEWMEKPAAGDIDYDTGSDDNINPKGIISFLTKGVWAAEGSAAEIFDSETKDFPASLSAINNALPYANEYEPYGVSSRAGFLKLSLNAGFRYDEYLRDYTAHLVRLAKDPNDSFTGVPPYVPKLKSVSLHYKAVVFTDLSNGSAANFNSRSLRFFHIYPFGELEQHAHINGSAPMLLPQFTDETGIAHNGEFYIGLKDMKPDEKVQLLFQVLEGSTNPLLDKPDEHIRWSYLSGNNWKTFDKQLVGDATNQLIQSGIISFIMPDDADEAHTIMPAGLMWLRASVNEDAEAICKLIAVKAQAAVVGFTNNDNAADFLNNALPAATIAKLKEPLAAIRKVEQPYSSFGGRPVETTEHFYLRVSERLRHKSRAINIWDYEHLILEAFPEIHRVKCLNHTKYVNEDYNEIAPGYVTIITIPSLVNNNETNPLRPYTKEDTLQKIAAFLQKKISAHIQLCVRQPQFEEVMLDFKLKLLPGYEFGFYSMQLQQDITAYMTPWAYGASGDVQFGGKISKSVLINFIEERHYVDFITEVKMYWRATESDNFSADMDEVQASSARSVLVSVQASKHNIVDIGIANENEDINACLDTWNNEQPLHGN